MAYSNYIEMLSPVGGEIWDKINSQEIKWKGSSDIANVSIHYSTNGGASWTQIVASTTNDGSYDWDTSGLAVGSSYQIQVRNYVSPSLFGTSNKFTIQERGITLLNPTESGVEVSRKTSYDVSFTKTESVKLVDITLYKGGVAQFPPLIEDFKGTKFLWQVDNSLATGSDYKIRVSDSDDATLYSESANNIRLSDVKSITITSPAEDDIIDFEGETKTISWTSVGVGSVDIDLYKNGVFLKHIAKAVESSPYSCEFVSNYTIGNDYSVVLSDNADKGVHASVDIKIGIKYFYDVKYSSYYSTSTNVYIPLNGTLVERTSLTYSNEYVGFVAPYNGQLLKIIFRSEVAQDGSYRLGMYESDDGTEVPTSSVMRIDQTIDIADDTALETDTTTGFTSGDNKLDKGKIYAISILTPSASNDTNVTLVFKWDKTS